MKKTLTFLTVLAAACGSDATSDLVSSTKVSAEQSPPSASGYLDVGPNGLQLSPGGAVQQAAPGVPAVSARTGMMPGEIPWRDPSIPNPDASGCAGAKLLYYGGPVLQNVKIYMVNWGTNIDSTITTTMPQFYAAVSNSAYLDWLSEYNTAGLNGQDGQPGSNQGISRGSFAGSVTINPSRCSGTGACTVTDAQLQSELNAQIAAGALPAPTIGCDGLPNTIYMVNFIAAITIRDPNNTRSCVAGGFCAYHGTATRNGTNYAYGVIPSMLSGGCSTGCGTSAAKINNETSVSSHELVEAITDTNVGLATVVGRPLAWYDSNCGEIGDICNGQQQTITISGTTWTVQQQWSNAVNDCIVSKASLPSLCTGANTPPGCRSCTCADDGEPAGCTGSLPWCETRTGNIKKGDCVQCVADNECPAGDVCPATSSAATDDVCTVCGATGQACCSGNTCNAGNVCSGGNCVACGAPSQACCSGNTCNAGDVCNAGTCCVPITTCPSGDNCGTVSNGCGGTVSCGGPCTSPQSCGGGGVANQCGCTPTTTSCPPGSNCGTVPNGCGGTVSCGGPCTSPQSCGGGGTANQCGCTPTTTSCPPGSNCGTVPNGCGGTVSCGGPCTSPQSCGGGGTANQCGCTPTTTSCPPGSNCGTVPNGCGGTVSCGGPCTSPQSCGGGGVANQCGCTPTTTSCPPGSNCGTVPNGCGGTVSCGGPCTSPQSCGGGGVANQCGCTPTTTSCPPGSNCGTVPNGCGGTVSCGGPCTSPQSCGGGGTANQCGCTPTVTMCPPGSDCGMIPNGCGGFVVCGGACTSPQSCGGGGVMNQCGCTPTVTSCPAGADCGTVPDGCGGTVTCGPACTSPQSCGGGGTANQCGCTNTTCAAQSADCGTIPDGCGGTLTCPTCASGTMCAANKCVANPPDLAMPPADLSMMPPDLAAAPKDLAVAGGDDLAANPPPDLAMGNGGKGGCGCRVGGESGSTPPLTSLAVALLLGLGLLRRRRSI